MSLGYYSKIEELMPPADIAFAIGRYALTGIPTSKDIAVTQNTDLSVDPKIWREVGVMPSVGGRVDMDAHEIFSIWYGRDFDVDPPAYKTAIDNVLRAALEQVKRALLVNELTPEQTKQNLEVLIRLSNLGAFSKHGCLAGQSGDYLASFAYCAIPAAQEDLFAYYCHCLVGGFSAKDQALLKHFLSRDDLSLNSRRALAAGFLTVGGDVETLNDFLVKEFQSPEEKNFRLELLLGEVAKKFDHAAVDTVTDRLGDPSQTLNHHSRLSYIGFCFDAARTANDQKVGSGLLCLTEEWKAYHTTPDALSAHDRVEMAELTRYAAKIFSAQEILSTIAPYIDAEMRTELYRRDENIAAFFDANSPTIS